MLGVTLDLSALTRADLKTLAPYIVPADFAKIRLADNENPYDFPDEVRDKIYQAIGKAEFNRYPDTNAEQLREKLAVYAGVSKENIMVGNGSDELILSSFLAFGVGASFIVTTPTFSMYGIHGRVAGAREIVIPRQPDFSLDVSRLISAAASPDVKLMFLCNPNSPTGNITPTEVIEEILANSNAVVVVDEAYSEFSGTSVSSLLGRYPNLVILRTFSKALSLAGLRVGYLLATDPLIQELYKVKPPYNLNSFSQAAAITVLENLHLFQTRVKAILIQREKLAYGLSQIPGTKVYPTVTNFILFHPGLPSKLVYDGLVEREIQIRIPGDPALAGCLRVTVGTEKENNIFLAALKEINYDNA